MTQKERIASHLLKGKTITPMEALVVFNCFRLASRVNELRRQGMDIETVIKQDENGKRYACYSLAAKA